MPVCIDVTQHIYPVSNSNRLLCTRPVCTNSITFHTNSKLQLYQLSMFCIEQRKIKNSSGHKIWDMRNQNKRVCLIRKKSA